MKAYLFQSFFEKITDKKPQIEPTHNQKVWLEAHPSVELISESFVNSNLANSYGLNKLAEEINAGTINKGSYVIFDGFNKITHHDIEQLDSITKLIWSNGVTIVSAHDGIEYPPSTLELVEQRIGLLHIINSAVRASTLKSERAKKAHQVRKELESTAQ